MPAAEGFLSAAPAALSLLAAEAAAPLPLLLPFASPAEAPLAEAPLPLAEAPFPLLLSPLLDLRRKYEGALRGAVGLAASPICFFSALTERPRDIAPWCSSEGMKRVVTLLETPAHARVHRRQPQLRPSGRCPPILYTGREPQEGK